MIEHATRELLASRDDVWRLLAEPYHLPDWWPAYSGVRPDRRGVAENARWTVVRSRSPGFLRRPSSEGIVVITRVVQGLELAWYDVAQAVEASIELATVEEGRTSATVTVRGSWWRLSVEGGRGLPRRALERLHALCQTAGGL